MLAVNIQLLTLILMQFALVLIHNVEVGFSQLLPVIVNSVFQPVSSSVLTYPSLRLSRVLRTH